VSQVNTAQPAKPDSAAAHPAADALRLAMRRVASTVALITVRHEGVNHGVAATAVSSVSMEPPSMLVVLNTSASALAPLLAGGRFCINFLSEKQEPLSRLFGSKAAREERFRSGTWIEEQDYVSLDGAQARAFCVLRETLRYGTHVICVGEAERVLAADPVNPLIYLDGRYFGAARCAAPGA